MNLVLDTNVLIAAFISKGSCHTLVEQCLSVHSCMTSEFILNELREKLTKKFKSAPLESNVCRDPDDDRVLATAITGNAVCIITGDKDLLILKKFGEIDILSPSELTDYESSVSSNLKS